MNQLSLAARTLRSARERAGLSLREAAKRAATSHSALSAYERGERTPTLATFFHILEALGFAVRVELDPRIRQHGGVDRGEELEQVLQLAERFPARERPEVVFSSIVAKPAERR